MRQRNLVFSLFYFLILSNEALLQGHVTFQGMKVFERTIKQKSGFALYLSKNNHEDEEEDDDDDEIENDMEFSDWRAFRSKLAALENEDERPVSVSKQNEALLLSQNEGLATEYTEVWAHTSPEPEIGGLLARMPIEFELYRRGKKEDNVPYHKETKEWYKYFGKRVSSVLESLPKTSTPIDPSTLPAETRQFLELFIQYQQSWQQIALVHSKTLTHTSFVVINRPMSLKLSEDLAALILFGASNRPLNASTKNIYFKFLTAFESECYVYVGGPQNQTSPATLIHGIPTLANATEISPGTGIYTGPISSAIDAVISKQYKPIDFRFFFGSYTFPTMQLQKSIELGRYQPVACARCVALKQCIGLPKPLWNEVLELCGGEYAEISKLEFSKRDDLEADD